MTQTIPTQVRINKDVKTKAVKIFNKLGLDMSSAINIFLNQCIINDGIPFVISSKKNEKLESLINEAREVHNSKTIKGFHHVDELFEDMGYDK